MRRTDLLGLAFLLALTACPLREASPEGLNVALEPQAKSALAGRWERDCAVHGHRHWLRCALAAQRTEQGTRDEYDRQGGTKRQRRQALAPVLLQARKFRPECLALAGQPVATLGIGQSRRRKVRNPAFGLDTGKRRCNRALFGSRARLRLARGFLFGA